MKRLIFAVIAVLLGVPAFGQVGPIVSPGGGAVTPGGLASGLYCADAGASDAYACTISGAVAYTTGAQYAFKANTANTGAATINFNGLGAKTIVKVAGGVPTTLANNDIRAGQIVYLVYDGTNMQMQSILGNAPAGAGDLLAANNLSDVASAATSVNNLGGAASTGTGGLVRLAGPTFTGTVGAASLDLSGILTTENGVNYCLDAVGTDSYACSLSPAIAGYVTGTVYTFKAGTANTGAASLDLNALGAKTIVKTAGGITTALSDNDIRLGSVVQVVYDGTNLQLVSPMANAAGGGMTVGGAITGGTANRGLFETSTNTLGQAAGWTVSDTGLTVIGTGITTGVPLTVNNGTSTGNVAVFQDNGTPVVAIADGGATTFTQSVRVGSGTAGAPGLAFDNGTWGFYQNGGNTTIGVSVAGSSYVTLSDNVNKGPSLGSGSNLTWANAADPNGATKDLFLTREGAAILQFGVDVNGAAVAQTLKAHDGITGTDIAGANLTLAGGRGTGAGVGGDVYLQASPALASGTTAQTLESRFLIKAKQFALADNTATTFAISTLGNDTFAGGTVHYCVYAADATTAGQECGSFDFGGQDVTAGAGGETCATPGKIGTPLQVLTGSTLSVTFAATTGTDLCNWRVTADTDIVTPINLYIKLLGVHNSGAAFAAQ